MMHMQFAEAAEVEAEEDFDGDDGGDPNFAALSVPSEQNTMQSNSSDSVLGA